ncbi:MAG: hypothetical protein ABFQ53_03240, partial [Patescibacteria group bacterium]
MKSLDFYFSSKHKNEDVLFIIHRHWFDMFLQFLPIFGLIALMTISFIFYPYIFDSFSENGGREIFFFMQSFFFLMIWIFGFMIWFDYYLDIWIMTTDRVVNVDQKGLFS